MFKKHDYIRVRGIGKITLKPDPSLDDIQQVCEIASSIPFLDIIDENGEKTGKQTYVPERKEFSFWLSLLAVLSDYDMSDRDPWVDFHTTSLLNKVSRYYREYIEEIYESAMERIDMHAAEVKPVNEAAIFDAVSHKLEGVEIEDLLNVAQSISQMNGAEIVRAVAENVAP
jgi:hypothetical protein